MDSDKLLWYSATYKLLTSLMLIFRLFRWACFCRDISAQCKKKTSFPFPRYFIFVSFVQISSNWFWFHFCFFNLGSDLGQNMQFVESYWSRLTLNVQSFSVLFLNLPDKLIYSGWQEVKDWQMDFLVVDKLFNSNIKMIRNCNDIRVIDLIWSPQNCIQYMNSIRKMCM